MPPAWVIRVFDDLNKLGRASVLSEFFEMLILQNARHGPSNASVHNPLLLTECFNKAPQLRRFERRHRLLNGCRSFGLILNGVCDRWTSGALIVSKDFHKLTKLGRMCFGVWTWVSSTVSGCCWFWKRMVVQRFQWKRARIRSFDQVPESSTRRALSVKPVQALLQKRQMVAGIQTHYRPALSKRTSSKISCAKRVFGRLIEYFLTVCTDESNDVFIAFEPKFA